MKRNLSEQLELLKDDLWEQLENLPINKKIGLVNEINSYDRTLDYLSVYENVGDFFETFFRGDILEAIRAAVFGNYRYTDEFVRFDGYGNLESFSGFEFESDFYDAIQEIVDWIIDNPNTIDLDWYIDTELLYNYLQDLENSQ